MRGAPTLGILSRLARDRRGVSALEFALIAPVLIVMLLGMDETASAVTAQRRVGHATSEIGDLVSQYTTIQQRITSIMMDGNSTPRVNWSCSTTSQTALTATAAGTSMTSLPKDSGGNYILLSTTAGDSVIMVESTYAYTSPVKYFIPNGITFSNTFYYKPRESTQVVLQAGTSSSSPTSSTSAWTSSSSSVSYSYSSATASPSLTCNYQNN